MMRLVDLVHGKLELRWTWLPYWLSCSAIFQTDVERLMRDVVVINGLPHSEESLDKIEAFLLREVSRRFKIQGLDVYLRGLRSVTQP